MTRSVALQPKAESDIENTFRYLTRESSISVADRFLDQTFLSFNDIAAMPGIGTTVDSKRLTSLRRWRVKEFQKYLIFYFFDDATVSIVRVLHGARDIVAIPDEPD